MWDPVTKTEGEFASSEYKNRRNVLAGVAIYFSVSPQGLCVFPDDSLKCSQQKRGLRSSARNVQSREGLSVDTRLYSW
jgi:hypothetical protein